MPKLSNDHKATLLGLLGAAMQAAGIDWYLLLWRRDPRQLCALGVAVATALLGYYCNRPDGKRKNDHEETQSLRQYSPRQEQARLRAGRPG
jgi:hypothetical protein